MARFQRELAGGWEHDENPPADHLFGAYSTGVRCCAASARRRSSTNCCPRRSWRRSIRILTRVSLTYAPAGSCSLSSQRRGRSTHGSSTFRLRSRVSPARATARCLAVAASPRRRTTTRTSLRFRIKHLRTCDRRENDLCPDCALTESASPTHFNRRWAIPSDPARRQRSRPGPTNSFLTARRRRRKVDEGGRGAVSL